MDGPKNRFFLIAFNQSGSRIVTAHGRFVQVWDTVTYRPIGLPALHEKPIRTISFCSNDACVITESGYTRAAVWNAETGEQVEHR
jgi:WD40 repeat protein